MEATISALTQSIPAVPVALSFQEVTMERINFWISWLGVSTGILSAFFTVTLGVLAYFTWKQSELRKQAEVEVEKISKIVKEINRIAENTKKTSLLVKKYQEESSGLVTKMGKDLVAVKNIVTKIKKKGSNVEQLTKKLETKTKNLNASYASLATLPSVDPKNFIVPTKSENQGLLSLSDSYSDLFNPPNSAINSGYSTSLTDILKQLDKNDSDKS